MNMRLLGVLVCALAANTGCQRAPLKLTADSQAAPSRMGESPEPVIQEAKTESESPAPDRQGRAKESPVPQPATAETLPELPQPPSGEPKPNEFAVAAAPEPAPVAIAEIIVPLPAALTIGPPKSMPPPTIPFSTAPRPARLPPTELAGKRELYQPACAAVEFVPQRLPTETEIPVVFRPALDEPEISRGDNPRPDLPIFPRGLAARKDSVDPSAVPPLAPLSMPQLEKVLPTSDPGDRVTRSASLPVAQPTRPESAPTDPRMQDPQENERAFRLAKPPPEIDPPASVPAVRPSLSAREEHPPKR